jgi:uncharacterized protein YqeY
MELEKTSSFDPAELKKLAEQYREAVKTQDVVKQQILRSALDAIARREAAAAELRILGAFIGPA